MTLYIMAEYSQAEYVNSVIQIDMQSDNVIGVSADADIHFMNHSLKLKASGILISNKSLQNNYFTFL